MMRKLGGGLLAVVVGLGAVGGKAMLKSKSAVSSTVKGGGRLLADTGAKGIATRAAVRGGVRVAARSGTQSQARTASVGSALAAPAGVTAHQTIQRKNAEADYEKGNEQANKGRYAQALPHWEKAATNGHEEAAFRLGMAYYQGARGVLPNRTKGEEWLKKAAALEHGAAARFMGDISLGKPAEAVAYYETAIEAGVPEASFRAAEIYANGGEGLVANPVRAAQLYQKAMDEEDHAGAMHRLAVWHVTGAGGITPDAMEAARLLRLSATKGYAPAQLGYGQMLMTTPDDSLRDEVEGYSWVVMAWQADQPGAKEFLLRMRETLSPDQLAASAERVKALPRLP